MNRKKMLIAILAIALLVGTASALLIPHFGLIKTIAEVDQAVLVDGKGYVDMPIEDAITAVGGESVCRHHWLKSKTSVPVELQFETSFSPTLTSGEITVTYLKPVEYSYAADIEVDGFGTLGVTVEDTGDGWLEWTYTYATNPTHTPKMTVAINYSNGFAITTFDDGTHDGWYYAVDGGATTRLGEYTGVVTGWVETSASANVLTVSIKKSALPNEFLWHGYANYNGQQVWIEINTTTWVPTGEATILEPIDSPFTLGAGERIDFYICYSFAPLIKASTYTIYSTVKPA